MSSKSSESSSQVKVNCENCIRLKIQLGLTQNALKIAINKIRELDEFINTDAQNRLLNLVIQEEVSTEN